MQHLLSRRENDIGREKKELLDCSCKIIRKVQVPGSIGSRRGRVNELLWFWSDQQYLKSHSTQKLNSPRLCLIEALRSWLCKLCRCKIRTTSRLTSPLHCTPTSAWRMPPVPASALRWGRVVSMSNVFLQPLSECQCVGWSPTQPNVRHQSSPFVLFCEIGDQSGSRRAQYKHDISVGGWLH